VERGDPLGLARAGAVKGGSATLWVHPRRHPVRVRAGTHPRHHHDGPVVDASVRGSMDLRAVREYVPGDEPRYVNWRATARTGQLMVCDYVDPMRPRFAVVLDTRAEALDPDAFEAAVEVAASLVHASAVAGFDTRLCTTTGLDVRTTGELGAGRRLLDRLCEVAQEPGGPLRPDALLGPAPGGSLVYVGGAGEPGLIAVLRRRFPEVVLVTLAAQPVAAAAPGVVRLTAPDAPAAVAAWNALVAGR
jgi:uncharacterized protein (DUF58 family)